jgi:hypothetical protein
MRLGVFPFRNLRRGMDKDISHCMQTWMHAGGSLIPTEAQPSGLERRQNSVMGSSKTVHTMSDEGENEARVRTTHALSVGDVRNHNYMLVLTGESLRQIILAFLPLSLHMQFKTKLYLEWNELLEKSGGLLAKASN